MSEVTRLIKEREDWKARAERAEAALREVLRDYEIMEQLPKRARAINVVEDAEVKELCKRFGYGAVMDSASRQWFLTGGICEVGAVCSGPCFGTVTAMLEQIRAALAPASAQEGDEHAPAQPSACAARAEIPHTQATAADAREGGEK